MVAFPKGSCGPHLVKQLWCNRLPCGFSYAITKIHHVSMQTELQVWLLSAGMTYHNGLVSSPLLCLLLHVLHPFQLVKITLQTAFQWLVKLRETDLLCKVPGANLASCNVMSCPFHDMSACIMIRLHADTTSSLSMTSWYPWYCRAATR